MEDSLERLSTSLAGRYTIESRAGQGGMATVYRAMDQKHHRLVAIKVLRPELSATVVRTTFRPRPAPLSPISPITRATVQRATGSPRRFSSRHTLRTP